jgi:hypothetical protein
MAARHHQGGDFQRSWSGRHGRLPGGRRRPSRSPFRCAPTSWSPASAPMWRAHVRPRPLQLARLGERVAGAVRKVPGAGRRARRAGRRFQVPPHHPDRNRLARYGLTIEDINQLTETLAVGPPVGDVLEGERRFAIVVRAHTASRATSSPSGRCRFVRSAGRWCRWATWPTGVRHRPCSGQPRGQSRRLTVEFNVRGRDLLSVVQEAQAARRDGGRPAGGLPGRVGRPVRALHSRPARGCRSWCRWRWRSSGSCSG